MRAFWRALRNPFVTGCRDSILVFLKCPSIGLHLRRWRAQGRIVALCGSRCVIALITHQGLWVNAGAQRLDAIAVSEINGLEFRQADLFGGSRKSGMPVLCHPVSLPCGKDGALCLRAKVALLGFLTLYGLLKQPHAVGM